MADTTPPSTPAAAPAAPAKPEPKPQITFDEFARVDLRIAKVLSAEDHPGADRLFVLKVDDGSGTPRQLCAGIRGHYAKDDLVGQTIVIVANLAPRVIRGQESRGMLLAASDTPKEAGDRRVILLTAASDIAPGAIVS